MKSRNVQTKEEDYEKAMKEALSEIFHNLREIEKDIKLQRQKVNLQRRRRSVQATTLKEVTAAFKQQEKEPY